ncbi:MAG: hypothetical protein ROW39_09880, partial [Anaerolineaceae bacterium]
PFGARAAKLTDYFEIELAILLAIVILPFTEELAFRGWFSKNRWVLTAGLTMLVCMPAVADDLTGLCSDRVKIKTVNITRAIICFFFIRRSLNSELQLNNRWQM